MGAESWRARRLRLSTMMRITLGWVALLGAFHVIAPSVAAAYIDPISGSIIIQVVVAAVLGVLLTVKRVWQRIIGFFKRIIKRPEQ